MNELIECEDCGCCFPSAYDSDVCPECEYDHAVEAAEQEQERRMETALSCKCGAWGISYSGRVYHAADCVCGAE